MEKLKNTMAAQDNIDLANLLQLYANIQSQYYTGFGKEQLEKAYQQEANQYRSEYQGRTNQVWNPSAAPEWGWTQGTAIAAGAATVVAATASTAAKVAGAAGTIAGAAGTVGATNAWNIAGWIALAVAAISTATAVITGVMATDNYSLTEETDELFREYLKDAKGLSDTEAAGVKYEVDKDGTITITNDSGDLKDEVVTADQLEQYYATSSISGAKYAHAQAAQARSYHTLPPCCRQR